MEKYIDAHCHINIGDVIPRGGTVAKFICNATMESDWRTLVEYHKSESNIYICLGLHPWYVAGASDDWDLRLRNLLMQNPSFMVGEIGLDRARENFDVQKSVFIRQFEMAAQLNRVVHLHCVRAWDEILHILKSCAGKLPPVIIAHAYSGTPDLIDELIHKSNMYFSYSAVHNDKVRNCILKTPINRILVESDSAPQMTQMKIPEIASEIAKIKSVDKMELSHILYENTLQAIQNG